MSGADRPVALESTYVHRTASHPGARAHGGRRPLIAFFLALTAAVAATVLVTGDREVSDAAGRVTVAVPRTWSDQTKPEAGGWVGRGENRYRVPDLEAGNSVHKRTIGVVIEPRERGLVERHRAEVDAFCYSRPVSTAAGRPRSR